MIFFFFSSRRRHTSSKRDWSSDVCSSDLERSGRPPRTRLWEWWAWVDLNHRPRPYQGLGAEDCAMTSKIRGEDCEWNLRALCTIVHRPIRFAANLKHQT